MKEKLIHILVVACFAALFYVNSFGNFFVWNDWTLIIENFLIRDWTNLPEIFTSAFWKPLIGEPSQVYRPLVSVSFMADFALWRLQPWGYHLTNVSFHVANSILAYFLMRVYTSPTIALMGSVLFAVHPIHTEAVTYISGRGELLMSFFLLGGTLLFLRDGKRKSWPLYLASLPAFFLALFSKETAAIFPLLLLSADVAAFPSSWRNNPWRQSARQLGPLFVLGLFYLGQMLLVGITATGHPFSAPSFSDHFVLTLKAISLCLGLLLFPLNLHFLHPFGASSPLDFLVALSLALLVAAGWGLRYAARTDCPAATFGISWFVIGLLPLVYYIGLRIPLLEGWIYLPSLGFVLLVALGLDSLKRWTPSCAPLWLTLWIAVMLGGVTFYRNRDWKDDMEISLHAIAASPNNPLALRLAGNAYMRHGNIPEAERMFQKGLGLAPADPGLHRSLAAAYRFMGKEADAVTHYQEALKSTLEEPYAYWLLGHYYLRRGKLVEAEKYFSEAVRKFPYSSELHSDLARAHHLQGNLAAAETELRAALRISPYSTVLKANLETILSQRKP
ncbi:MAG: hypothetical protein A2W73_01215 [Deltaproteobacteria bacterium RIFCSPLOWO2_12_55_13]|nr:MAG: hypothetical protein A2W73_01215 [Deltaproteobacteria bacterium RIFCSPLOWO2_12_55_13]